MKTAVAMATYNGARFLREQLESIRTQTYPVDEVILRDDGSADGTAELAEDYIQSYGLEEMWRVIRGTENLGYAENFRAAVAETTAEYVFFCDQDDIWEPGRVEAMLSEMEQNPQIGVLGSEFAPFTVDPDAPAVSRSVLKSFRNDGSLEQVTWSAAHIFIGSEGCTMCLRRSFLERTAGYWFAGWAHDEYAWKLALCEDSCYILHLVTLRRRMHSGNVSKRKMRELPARIRFFEALLQSHEMTLRYAQDCGLPEARLRLLRRNIRATKLRIGLMRERKLRNLVPLVCFYQDCYHSRKSIPVELLLAVRGGHHEQISAENGR